MGPSNKELKESLLSILKVADLNVTTERIVRKKLEEKFDCSLTDRKDFIRKEVGNFLNTRQDEAHGHDEDEDEIHDDAGQKKKRKPRRTKEEKAEKKRRVGGGGLNKMCDLSPELAGLFGTAEMPRTQVVKEVWNYIREHNLQDPSNKRRINCDPTLEKILGTNSTDMFQMNKLLSKHIFSKPNENGEVKEKKVKGEGKANGSQFSVKQLLSSDMQEFLGTGEVQLARHEVVSRMWAYIKEHSLQDPADKSKIICDEKLQKLFGVESFNGFVITKLLSPHIGVKRDIEAHSPVHDDVVKEESETEIEADAETDAGADAETDAGADAEADAGADAETEGEAEAETEVETELDAETEGEETEGTELSPESSQAAENDTPVDAPNETSE